MFEKSLVSKLKSKDESSYRFVFEKYYKLLFYETNKILNNTEDTKDVIQQTFLQFFNKIDELNEESNIKNYLLKISHNIAIDTYRKNKNIRETVSDDELFVSYDSPQLFIESFNNILTKEEENILILKIYFDYTFDEIAKEQNETINVIQAKYYKAIRKIKNYYKGDKNYEFKEQVQENS